MEKWIFLELKSNDNKRVTLYGVLSAARDQDGSTKIGRAHRYYFMKGSNYFFLKDFSHSVKTRIKFRVLKSMFQKMVILRSYFPSSFKIISIFYYLK